MNSPGKRTIAVATATVATAALTIGAFWLLDDDPESENAPRSAPSSVSEWRWESNRGIELQVPADWGYRVIGSDWCADRPKPVDDPAPGGVSRGQDVFLIGCDSRYPPLDQRKPSVTFRHYDLASHWPTGIERFDGGWVEESRKVHGVHVTVFTDDDRVRAHIFESARTVDGTDSYGCSVHHPAAVGRDYRPDAGSGGLAAVGEVEEISVCRYRRGDTKAPKRPLVSSGRMTGAAARDVVAATLAAPEGSGPNMPGGCFPEYDYGEEMLVLTVRGSKAVQEVVLRYDGCIGHGTDDGATQRRLTKESAGPLFDGPHRPSGVTGRWIARIVSTTGT
jgi:hypothetical protein